MTLEEIKSYLKVNKITYKKLSEQSGVPESTLKNLFSGATTNPRISTMQAIERALGIDKQPTATISNEITEERLQALGFDLSEIATLSDKDIETIRNTIRVLVENLKKK